MKKKHKKNLVWNKSFPIVGIGASAGGLEALIDLLKNMPSDIGMAFVIVQHLQPQHKSLLQDILKRNSKLNVTLAQDGLRLEPNQVYVIPPDANIAVSGDVLKISPRSENKRDQFMPIDFFLRSLAGKKGMGIAVILSGTGSDGTIGVKAVKDSGGIVFAQDEKSAHYPDMPHNAIATGSVDFILPPEKIADKLNELSRFPHASPAVKPGKELSSDLNESSLSSIFPLLLDITGVDFSSYKKTTVKRRTIRRMNLHHIQNYKDYFSYLQTHHSEVEALHNDLLISVTAFLREPEAFEVLREKVFPAIIRSKSTANPVRIWVPACSSGEEVYSIAFSLYDFLEEKKLRLPVRIFGSDLNEMLVSKARRGFFPGTIADSLPQSLLRRFFTRTDGGFIINKSIRDMCVFARQNLLTDPPLSAMDLISCRNVLIYMEPVLQEKLIPILHYALSPGGFLLLGRSESVGTFSNLFSPADNKAKIFAKKTVASRQELNFGLPSRARGIGVTLKHREEEKGTPRTENSFDPAKEADRILLGGYGPAAVLVNNSMEIIRFYGQTSLYLQPATGKASFNLMDMCRKSGLEMDLYQVITQAQKKARPERKESIRLSLGSRVREINLEVVPFKRPVSAEEFFLIIFEESAAGSADESKEKKISSQGNLQDTRNKRLRWELENVREYMQSVILEKDGANEELKAAQEELQSGNEELQSMNEELQTSKEELQSTNEELTTLNEELQTRNLELTQVNNDLSNILNSITIPMVILTKDLRIRHFTPAIDKIMNLIHSDVGRPVGAIKLNINIPDLEQLALDVIESAEVKEIEVKDNRGCWYSTRIRPYRTIKNKIDGVVIVFVDIDFLKRAQEKIQEASDFAQAIVETIPSPLLVLDGSQRILSANNAFYRKFKVSRADTEGQYIYDIGSQQWDIPQLRILLENILLQKTTVENYEIAADFPGLGTKVMIVNAHVISQQDKTTEMILLSLEDNTERKMAEEVLRRDKVKLEKLVQERSQELLDAKLLLEKEKRLSDIGTLAAIIAHELRNPLAAISVAAANIARKVKGQVLGKSLSNIQKKISESDQIINNLLFYSKIRPPQYENIAIFEIVVECIALAQKQKQKNEVVIEKRFDAIKDTHIEADSLQMKEVFSNIFNNAFDAVAAAGGKIEIAAFEEAEDITISIKNSGLEIKKEHLVKVFEPFFTTKAKGTGLGLAVCKQIIDLHGGSIHIGSNHGEGTTVIIRLPKKAVNKIPVPVTTRRSGREES